MARNIWLGSISPPPLKISNENMSLGQPRDENCSGIISGNRGSPHRAQQGADLCAQNDRKTPKYFGSQEIAVSKARLGAAGTVAAPLLSSLGFLGHSSSIRCSFPSHLIFERQTQEFRGCSETPALPPNPDFYPCLVIVSPLKGEGKGNTENLVANTFSHAQTH